MKKVRITALPQAKGGGQVAPISIIGSKFVDGKKYYLIEE